MKILKLYLWKEWRDQRTAVLALALLLPAAILATAFFVPLRSLRDPLALLCAASAASRLSLLAIGSDLLPGELRRGRVRFLERLPSGLPAAFAAKLAFLLATVGGAGLYAVVLALAASTLGTGASAAT